MKIQKTTIPVVERLNNGEPIIQRVPSHPWENKVTFNPACAFVSDQSELAYIIERLPFDDTTKKILHSQPGLCFLLYRAQGLSTPQHDYTCSSIGLAVLSPTLTLLARYSEPVILPDKDYDNLGVEDARITKIDNQYVMFYTAYSTGVPENVIRIAIATTTDFVHWEKHGLLRGDINTVQNKNALLFDRKIGGKYVMFHRPMQGEHAMTTHWGESDNILGEWKSRGLVMKSMPNPMFVDTWVGGGAPPLWIEQEKFLLIYHIGNRNTAGEREYYLGIAIVDFSSKEIIVKRNEPLLRPTIPAEKIADKDLGVGNVLFICGAYFYNSDLYFPYAGADSVVLGGRILKSELQKYYAS